MPEHHEHMSLPHTLWLKCSTRISARNVKVLVLFPLYNHCVISDLFPSITVIATHVSVSSRAPHTWRADWLSSKAACWQSEGKQPFEWRSSCHFLLSTWIYQRPVSGKWQVQDMLLPAHFWYWFETKTKKIHQWKDAFFMMLNNINRMCSMKNVSFQKHVDAHPYSYTF